MKTSQIASTELIKGLETFVPENGSLLILCENASGPYCKTEDYEKMENSLRQEVDHMRTLLKAWNLVANLHLAKTKTLPDHCQRALYDRTAALFSEPTP